jgi:hypothetical protein
VSHLDSNFAETGETPGQSHLMLGNGSTGRISASQLSKLCYADALYKPFKNLDAIALGETPETVSPPDSNLSETPETLIKGPRIVFHFIPGLSRLLGEATTLE